MKVGGLSVTDTLLVQEVRQHTMLYDPKKRAYCNQAEKDEVWDLVASNLGVQAIDAKNRWRTVRDKFVREKKRLLGDGEQAYLTKDPWPLLDEMAFLWDFITHRKQGLNSTKQDPSDAVTPRSPVTSPAPTRKKRRSFQPILPRPGVVVADQEAILPRRRPSPEWVNCVALDYEAEGVVVEGDPAAMLFKSEEEVEEGRGSQLRRLLEDGISPGEELHPLLSDDSRSNDVKPFAAQDEDELFCLGVGAAFKRFSPKMKALAKWKIQQVLYDVEFNRSDGSQQ